VNCGHQAIPYNSCRSRYCPKCQGDYAHGNKQKVMTVSAHNFCAASSSMCYPEVWSASATSVSLPTATAALLWNVAARCSDLKSRLRRPRKSNIDARPAPASCWWSSASPPLRSTSGRQRTSNPSGGSVSIRHSRRTEEPPSIAIPLPCSTTQMPTCVQPNQFITMNGPDQIQLLAAAGLPGSHSNALMTHFDVLGPFKCHG
jgi:hypothetical protein